LRLKPIPETVIALPFFVDEGCETYSLIWSHPAH